MMKTKKLLLLALLLTAASFISCSSKSVNKYNLKKCDITITSSDGTSAVVNAEIAAKQEERNWGFMERKNIPDGTGMIFVFARDQKLSFWMKNTPHPLSIAYIDSKGTIRDIFDMTPFSEASITSTVSVRYALEVPQGWYNTNKIKEGDKISLNFLD